MQPLYFLPGVFRQQLVVNEELSRSVLVARGLAETFADVRAREFIATNIEGNGPGKLSGVILAYHTADGELPQLSGYVEAAQEWTPIDDGNIWIGLAREMPPKPAELRRRKLHPGYDIELGGHMWQVPVIRRVDDSTELPRDCYFSRGQLVEPIKAAYTRYWEASKEVADWFYADNWKKYTKARGLMLAIEALSLNYRIGQAEQSLLRIVDVETLLTVLMATVDVPHARALEDAQKKTPSPSDPESTTPGLPDA